MPDYTEALQYHFRPERGWMNDPNGLVCYKGYYHLFFQYSPNFETPGQEPVVWGHARTKDFLHWEELPLALEPSQPADKDGCWSGTAVVRDDRLYLFYASVINDPAIQFVDQSVSVAWSDDGIHFTKYENNPVIPQYPADGSFDFRDPAVLRDGDTFYLVMGSGNEAAGEARLLLYQSDDLLHWTYKGVMCSWPAARCCECPSFVRYGEEYLLSTSVMYLDGTLGFSVMIGSFDGSTFTPRVTGQPQKGPDQYAGQIFRDEQGRALLIAWIPGWSEAFRQLVPRCIGCQSVPIELYVKDDKVCGRPAAEVRHLLRESDPAVTVTAHGFIVARQSQPDVEYHGEIRDIRILRDGYVLEIFLNGGEEIYSVVLC